MSQVSPTVPVAPREVCPGDLAALKVLAAPEKSHRLSEVLEAVSYPNLSNYQPKEDKKRGLMLNLIAALQGERHITTPMIEIIVIHILLAPPPEDKNDNKPALQLISQTEDVAEDARESIDLNARAPDKLKCRKLEPSSIQTATLERETKYTRQPLDSVQRASGKYCRKFEPSSIEVVKVNGLTKSVCVFDRDFYRWFDSAPIDDAMSYFGAIATILLRAHVTSAEDIKHAIYGLVQLWPTFSSRTRPLSAFSIKESALEKLCELIRCDEIRFRSVLKMLIVHHHKKQTAGDNKGSKAAYFEFMVETPFAYHGLETFRIVDRITTEYQLEWDLLVKLLARYSNDNSVFYRARKCVEVKKYLTQLDEDTIFKPYGNLFEPLLFTSVAVEKTKELLAVSAGLLGMRDVLQLELFKSDAYLQSLYARGVKANFKGCACKN